MIRGDAAVDDADDDVLAAKLQIGAQAARWVLEAQESRAVVRADVLVRVRPNALDVGALREPRDLGGRELGRKAVHGVPVAIDLVAGGTEAAEQVMRAAARKLYQWAELESSLFIRPACTEPFVSRGTLQMLADDGRVGWHPEFMQRLKHVLEQAL